MLTLDSLNNWMSSMNENKVNDRAIIVPTMTSRWSNNATRRNTELFQEQMCIEYFQSVNRYWRHQCCSCVLHFSCNFLNFVALLYSPLALEGAWRGCGGIVTVLLITGEGLLGCGLGVRCLLCCWRVHLKQNPDTVHQHWYVMRLLL